MFFDFLQDTDNYEERKVDRFEKDDMIIDTCYASDTGLYETAISHPKYNGGSWIIVEEYENREEAQKGHNKWVKKMTSKKLPKNLKDVSSTDIAELMRDIDGDMVYERED